VTGPRRNAWGQRACVHVALLLAGARPVHGRPGARFEVEELDGLVITGGHDVEPVLYRAVAEVQGRYDPERDAFEVAVLTKALALRKPILAICRGAQLLNVHLGGTLFQDLTAHRSKTSSRRSVLPLKTLKVKGGSKLMRTLGRATLKVNSLHRQAIDRLGDGLRISGRDHDAIVQAVEHVGHEFVLGVQWHPELLIYLGRQRRLFAHLVDACARTRQGGRARGQPASCV